MPKSDKFNLRLDEGDMENLKTLATRDDVSIAHVVRQAIKAYLAENNGVELGLERYGTKLQTFNGRDALWDAYQEALDLVMYLRQAIMEREAK